MLVKQADLFWGLGKAFVQRVHEESEKESHPAGSILFREGDSATHFYTMIKGRVRLGLGERIRTVYLIDRAGESFGWSSIVERDRYSATAECLDSTTVVKFEREKFARTLQEFPSDGMLFMKRLAAMLGQRLLKSFEISYSATREEVSWSSGTGQLLDGTLEET